MDPLSIVPCVLTLNAITVSYLISHRKEYHTLAQEKQYELVNRITGSMFQLYLCYSGFYLNLETSESFLRSFAGYILYDTGHMIMYTDSLPMYMHHFVVLFFFVTRFLFSAESRSEFANYIWILESTAPCLSVCWILHVFKYPTTHCYRALTLLVFIYWAVIRVGVFPYMLYMNDSVVIRLGGSMFVALNLYWCRLLLKKF
jgi:hypothetical protein